MLLQENDLTYDLRWSISKTKSKIIVRIKIERRVLMSIQEFYFYFSATVQKFFLTFFFPVFQQEMNVKLIWPSWLVLGSASGACAASPLAQGSQGLYNTGWLKKGWYKVPLSYMIYSAYYCRIRPHLHKRGAIIRAVYHVREWRFKSNWFKHPVRPHLRERGA